MKTTSILCPIDFSACSMTALKEASRRAAEDSAKLYIFFVDDSGKHLIPGQNGYVAELDGYRRLLEEGVPTEANVEFEQHYVPGEPAAEIVRFARLREIDTIIMGTHGRSGLAKLFMGSVAEGVTDAAGCDVVTIKADGSEAQIV